MGLIARISLLKRKIIVEFFVGYLYGTTFLTDEVIDNIGKQNGKALPGMFANKPFTRKSNHIIGT
jgi:predicted DNA-binding transcriptional regulator